MNKFLLALAITPFLCSAAFAAEFKVTELNTGEDGAMVFQPDFLRVKPGDTVRVVASDKGHDIQSIDTMAPAGAAPFKGVMGQDAVLHFTKGGVYGFRCLPHYGLGMVLLVQVGSAPPNLVQAKAAAQLMPPMAKKRFAAEFTHVN
jgi:pseudoazurin